MVIKMRKGIANQVFIYIFVVILMALIILFGFKQVVNLKNLGDKSVYVTFKSDFTNAVNDVYYMNKDSTLVFSKDSRNKALVLPKDIKKICFENNKVVLNSDNYKDFTVDNMVGSDCINAVNGGLSFRLENVVENQKVFVKVNRVGTE